MLLLATLFFSLLTSGVSAQSLDLSRTVEANSLTSRLNPAVRIELPKEVQYVGAHRWILYDIADCELHLFVEADQNKLVKRMYWLQFEGYIPSRPELRYKPTTTEITSIGGMDFYVRARFGLTTDIPVTGSDSERVQLLLKSKGYTLPPEMMNARFIHYLDEHKRQELMFIYSEDLSTSGFSVAQLLNTGGVLQPQWVAISSSLVQRARATVSMQRLSPP